MIGVIDIGNTRYHCGLGENISVIERLDTEEIDEVVKFFEGVDNIMVISVAEKRLRVLKRFLNGRIIRFPMDKIQRDYSGLVGEDRIAASLYVKEEGLYPCVVIDAGSAITVDIINEVGLFSGGAILSGVKNYLSLFKAQENLKHIRVEPEPLENHGKNTEECIRHGLYIYINGIMDYVDSLKIKRVIVTGGDAHLFMKRGWMHDRDIVLKGGLVAVNLFT